MSETPQTTTRPIGRIAVPRFEKQARPSAVYGARIAGGPPRIGVGNLPAVGRVAGVGVVGGMPRGRGPGVRVGSRVRRAGSPRIGIVVGPSGRGGPSVGVVGGATRRGSPGVRVASGGFVGTCPRVGVVGRS